MNNKINQGVKSKDKIMNIALEEFANNGYKGASTNSICKKTEISKGLLYHYFSSKEDIYNGVLDYALTKFKDVFDMIVYDDRKKGIDYISNYFNIKFNFLRDNPLISKLITGAILNTTSESARNFIKCIEEENNKVIYQVIEFIDINPRFDKRKAFELIMMIGEKLEEKHMKSIYISEDKAIENFRQDHKIMIEMIFEGIDR